MLSNGFLRCQSTSVSVSNHSFSTTSKGHHVNFPNQTATANPNKYVQIACVNFGDCQLSVFVLSPPFSLQMIGCLSILMFRISSRPRSLGFSRMNSIILDIFFKNYCISFKLGRVGRKKTTKLHCLETTA